MTVKTSLQRQWRSETRFRQRRAHLKNVRRPMTADILFRRAVAPGFVTQAAAVLIAAFCRLVGAHKGPVRVRTRPPRRQGRARRRWLLVSTHTAVSSPELA